MLRRRGGVAFPTTELDFPEQAVRITVLERVDERRIECFSVRGPAAYLEGAEGPSRPFPGLVLVALTEQSERDRVLVGEIVVEEVAEDDGVIAIPLGVLQDAE